MPRDRRRSPPSPPSPQLAAALLGLLFLAAVAVLSLPPARALSADFGWTPFWLLSLPASAWLALQLRRLAAAPGQATTGAMPRRRALVASSRRRAVAADRGARQASAA